MKAEEEVKQQPVEESKVQEPEESKAPQILEFDLVLPTPIQPTTIPKVLRSDPMPKDLIRLTDALPDRARDEPQDLPRYID